MCHKWSVCLFVFHRFFKKEMKFVIYLILRINILWDIYYKLYNQIYKKQNNCISVTLDENADIIDCKEFFEAFYHLATGFNYDINTGIPEDETEAEIYLTRLQDDFDEKMKIILGEKYLPGNNDPDSINNDK